MSAYYNELDPFAAQWLRNLIAAGHIAPGDVDERSIVDVRADDLAGYAQCHFFAGIGGWSCALRLAGWPDDRPVWTGSCPCQPFSLAGKQKGFDDARHLWPVWRELIAQRRPAICFGEQVASATAWLGLVRGDLEALGYAVGCMPVQAASAGADHLRDRYWFVADSKIGENRRLQQPGLSTDITAGSTGCDVGFSDCSGSPARSKAAASTRHGHPAFATGRCDSVDVVNASRLTEREPHNESDAVADGGQARSVSRGAGDNFEWVIGADGKARRVKPGLRLLAHGVSARVGKLRGFGNAIDPRPAAQFIAASIEAIEG